MPGAGSHDNGSFQIVGSTLRTKAVFNYEAKSTYSVRVRATNFGTPAGQIARSFTITVSDADEAPTAHHAAGRERARERAVGHERSGTSRPRTRCGPAAHLTLVAGRELADNGAFTIVGTS